MSIAMVLKIFSDCCICFAILGSGPLQLDIPLLIPAFLYGASAGMASFFEEKGQPAIRRLCALLPLCCLLLARSWQQGLLLIIPALYTSLVILRGKLELEYYSYRRFFLRSLILVGAAYLIVNIWAFLAQATNDPLPELDAGVILRYGLVHLLCGVVLQRQLRLGVGYRSEGGRRQLSMLLGTAGTIVLGFFAAEPLLRQGITALAKGVVSLIGLPFLFIFELFVWVVDHLRQSQSEKLPDHSSVNISGDGAVTSTGEQVGQIVNDRVEKAEDPTLIWVVLVVIFLLAAAVIVFRSFQKRHAAGDSGEIEGGIVTAPKKKKASALSNRSKVRQLYREFLRVENGSGLKLKPCDTSEDILRRIHPNTNRESANDLRQVYLIARYDDRQSISRGQVNQAKRALKGTRRTRT